MTASRQGKHVMIKGSSLGSAYRNYSGSYVEPTRSKKLESVMKRAMNLLRDRDENFMASLEATLLSDPSFANHFREIFINNDNGETTSEYASRKEVNRHALTSYCNTVLFKSMNDDSDTIGRKYLSSRLAAEEIERYAGGDDIHSVLYESGGKYPFFCASKGCSNITSRTITGMRTQDGLCSDCHAIVGNVRKNKEKKSTLEVSHVLSERDEPLIISSDRRRNFSVKDTYGFKCIEEGCDNISHRTVRSQKISTGKCFACSRVKSALSIKETTPSTI